MIKKKQMRGTKPKKPTSAEMDELVAKYKRGVLDVFNSIACDLPPGNADIGDMADCISCHWDYAKGAPALPEDHDIRFAMLKEIVKRCRIYYI